MFDRGDLRAAVSANVLTPEQAARLEAFIASRHGSEAGDPDTENLRFLSNFNDIFITIGLAILLFGATGLWGLIISPFVMSSGLWAGLVMAGPMAALSWFMLEYFCARRRLLLPSMALSVAFVVFIMMVSSTIGANLLLPEISTNFSSLEQAYNTDWFVVTGRVGLVTTFGAILASAAVYLRFQLPFAMAQTALAISVFSALLLAHLTGNFAYGPFLLIMGLLTLLVAIRFDMRDPKRLTKQSDSAFWLHAAAAPQILYGVKFLVSASEGMLANSTTQSVALICVLGALSILALAINRRALIAVSLITFLTTIWSLLSDSGLSYSNVFITTTLLVGGGVVLLGAGWRTARRLILTLMPRGGVWSRLFPDEPT